MCILQTQTPMIFSFIIFILMRFRSFTLLRYVCASVSIHFQTRLLLDRCVFYENAQRSSVDGRLKRIQMDAFSNENAWLWTGP